MQVGLREACGGGLQGADVVVAGLGQRDRSLHEEIKKVSIRDIRYLGITLE